jgi:hypothetical protein
MFVSAAYNARYCNASVYSYSMVGGEDGVNVFATRCLVSEWIEEDISAIS